MPSTYFKISDLWPTFFYWSKSYRSVQQNILCTMWFALINLHQNLIYSLWIELCSCSLWGKHNPLREAKMITEYENKYYKNPLNFNTTRAKRKYITALNLQAKWLSLLITVATYCSLQILYYPSLKSYIYTN